jgi:ATP-dependent Lhr-like helicase
VKGYNDEWVSSQSHGSDSDEAEISKKSIDEREENEQSGSAMLAIADYLYRHLRGSNNLVFPNSRSRVEYYADQLRRRCEREASPMSSGHIMGAFHAN